MLIHSCTFCGHQFEGVPTEEDVQEHLPVCPGPPPPEDCVCANRVGLAKALPCSACAAQARQEFSG